MGLLHGHFLEKAGWRVACLDRPGSAQNQRCGVIPLGEHTPRVLQAKSIIMDNVQTFWKEANLKCILSAVKAHDIHEALKPVIMLTASSPPNAVVLLHNGLTDANTSNFVKSFIPQAATMISTNGSTLLHNYLECDIVAKHMGLGSTILFPNHSNPTNDLTKILEALSKAFPGDSQVQSHLEGKCEQILKLAINISINGLSARKALKNWSHNCPTVITPLKNQELYSELDLARSIARLILLRALAAYPDNPTLQLAVDNDEAANRTCAVISATSQNICSTISDLMNGRRTERSALLDTVMYVWPQDVDSADINATQALMEINDALLEWDQSVMINRSF